jgi:hypothetical protein
MRGTVALGTVAVFLFVGYIAVNNKAAALRLAVGLKDGISSLGRNIEKGVMNFVDDGKREERVDKRLETNLKSIEEKIERLESKKKEAKQGGEAKEEEKGAGTPVPANTLIPRNFGKGLPIASPFFRGALLDPQSFLQAERQSQLIDAMVQKIFGGEGSQATSDLKEKEEAGLKESGNSNGSKDAILPGEVLAKNTLPRELLFKELNDVRESGAPRGPNVSGDVPSAELSPEEGRSQSPKRSKQSKEPSGDSQELSESRGSRDTSDSKETREMGSGHKVSFPRRSEALLGEARDMRETRHLMASKESLGETRETEAGGLAEERGVLLEGRRGDAGSKEKTKIRKEVAEENSLAGKSEEDGAGKEKLPEEFRTPEMRKFLEALSTPQMGESSSSHRTHAPEGERTEKSDGHKSKEPGNSLYREYLNGK